MSLFELCIRRPVLASVLSLMVLVIGVISYTRLAVREYPKIDEPVVSVTTTYPGASAEVVESQITKVLEDSLAGIEGVELMTSRSRSERSDIDVRFRITRDPDSAAADVRDKVARVRARLPDNVDEPVIAKVEADAFPIIWMAVTQGSRTPIEVSDYLARYVKPRLSVLPGAADVWIFGERRPTMRIEVDRDRLAGYRLTVQDVEDALRRQNVELPSGRIESAKREFNIVAATDLQTVRQFEDAIIATFNGYPVRLRDVATVRIGALNERVIARFKGEPSINMGVVKQATGNPLDLSRAVRAEVEKINETLPPGMRITVVYDSSVFIEQSIRQVFTTVAEAVLLVVLVIFFFLRNFRATLIPLVTIPVSLIGAFALMYAFGFTINTLTLLAMVLAIGLVVDDAIVVLENIYRNIEHGMPRIEAAIKGIKEIGFAVVAMTLTLVAVFAPLAFSTGRTGRLFIEFALALAGAVLVSGFVALTLSPMMCSKLLRHEAKHGRLYNVIDGFLNSLTSGYARSLAWVLRHRWVVLAGWALAFAGAGALFAVLRSELAPLEDRGVIFGRLQAPPGSTVDYTSEQLRAVESYYETMPEAVAYNAIAGFPTVDFGNAILRLKPWDERTRKQQDITRELNAKFATLPGVIGFAVNPPSLGQSPRALPIEYVIMAQMPYPELDRIVNQFIAELSKYPGVQNLQTDLRLNTPELRVDVNRDKLGDLGIAVQTVGLTLQSMLGGRQVTRFKRDGEQYDVIVQVAPRDRTRPNDISDIYVRTRDGSMVQLANVVTVHEGVSPQSLNHFNRLRAVTVTGLLAPGYTLGDVLPVMDQVARQVLPPTALTDLNGQSREFRDTRGSIYLTFALAIIFIYLVLSAQFESFADPFVIMLSVPLSMTGALLALWAAGGTLNIYSQIGLITLVGLITKHGILIVEFSNQLRERGEALFAAVKDASVLRLRPILMTTGAMVLGAVPLALATGAGAESRRQIGWVIVGGLTLGTMLTLYVVPTVYTLMREWLDRGKPVPAPGGAVSAHGPAARAE
ncbi:efflux RND transporter permease subunit [Betaproteobacteria bacterium PRO7]|jgi:multidrug efflux pump|nr:efflux RND transporter permease subunit [Betaproteobacteria bacterium PRO7]GIL04997.1 MAG: acriflavin resistance protein [Betaproteobacteria bacterium]